MDFLAFVFSPWTRYMLLGLTRWMKPFVWLKSVCAENKVVVTEVLNLRLSMTVTFREFFFWTSEPRVPSVQ